MEPWAVGVLWAAVAVLIIVMLVGAWLWYRRFGALRTTPAATEGTQPRRSAPSLEAHPQV